MAGICKPAKGPRRFLKGGDYLSSCETVSALTRIVLCGVSWLSDSRSVPVLCSYKAKGPVITLCCSIIHSE